MKIKGACQSRKSALLGRSDAIKAIAISQPGIRNQNIRRRRQRHDIGQNRPIRHKEIIRIQNGIVFVGFGIELELKLSVHRRQERQSQGRRWQIKLHFE